MWLFVAALHCLCAVFLAQLARVYHVIASPQLEALAVVVLEDRYRYLPHARSVAALLSVLHCWQLFSILWSSVRARELVLADPRSSMRVIWENMFERTSGDSESTSASNATSVPPCPVFGAVFLLREAAEIVSQSFQARRASYLLSRPWLNHVLVALVVTNCWSTPVVQRVLGIDRGVERVVGLYLDAIINVGSSMAIPLAIFQPYYRTLPPTTLTFPVELLNNSVWFTRLVKENRLLFSLAKSDVVSKLIQHVGIYTALTSAAVLIFRRPTTMAVVQARAERAVSPRGDVVSPTEPDPDAVATTTNESTERRESGDVVVGVSASTLSFGRAWRRKRALVHLCYFAWGLVLLTLHIKVTVRFQQKVPGCRLASASWFTSGYPCSVYEYNCYRHGAMSPDEDSWRQLDPDVLAFLTITHCPELKMPQRFQRFHNLLVFQTYNVTVVEWGHDSAITPATHAHLTAVAIVRTNMTAIPDGMCQGLPDQLQSVQITHTNLTSLPPDLHTKWHALTTLRIEHSLLVEFPETLLALPVRDLSLHGNRIETVPGLSRCQQQFVSFVVSANPLVSLPDALGADATFTNSSAEHTLLETLPSWRTTEDAVCVVRDEHVDGRVPTRVFEVTYPL